MVKSCQERQHDPVVDITTRDKILTWPCVCVSPPCCYFKTLGICLHLCAVEFGWAPVDLRQYSTHCSAQAKQRQLRCKEAPSGNHYHCTTTSAIPNCSSLWSNPPVQVLDVEAHHTWHYRPPWRLVLYDDGKVSDHVFAQVRGSKSSDVPLMNFMAFILRMKLP